MVVDKKASGKMGGRKGDNYRMNMRFTNSQTGTSWHTDELEIIP